MKKIKRTVIAVTLAAALSLSSAGLSACGDDSIKGVSVWTVAATEKIRQDDLETAKAATENSINLRVIGGEVESYQIILTTEEKAVDEYTVETFDLTDGENTFDKKNITVYHEKYVFVDGKEYYNVAGYYPDCLVPFSSVEKLDENVVAANNNQGLYVSFDVPENQPSGTYSGSIKISVGKGSVSVPVKLTVSNASIGVETHSKSCFSVMWYHGKGELDYSPEMMDTYVKALMEYRLGANYVMYRSDDTDAEIAYYAKKVVEYAKMPESVNFGMQFRSVKITEYDWGGDKGVEKFDSEISMYDEEVMLKYFLAFYEEGLKENVNPFNKLFLKGFDEPKLNGTTSSVAIGAHIIHKTKEKAIEIMNAKNVENQTLLNEMHESLRNLENIITTAEVPSGFDSETMDLTFCPYFSSCATDSARDNYRDVSDNELWWYGCDFPTAPYPTYHLDNTLLSPRVLSWMQADYDIVGNLYWSCDFYGTNFTDERFLEDQYGGSGLRNTAAYGEGLLFYPGAKYGVDGPLPSMRLEAIRDGLEEYEMIYKLKDLYSKNGCDAETVMRDLYDAMYSSAQLHSSLTSDIFESCRNALISLLELAQSDAGVVISNVNSERGKTVYEFFVKDGYTPEFDSSFKSSTKTVDGGKIYTVEYAGEKENFDLSVNINGNRLSVSFSPINGEFYGAQTFKDNISSGSKKIDLSVNSVSGKSVNAAESEDINYLQLKFGATEGVEQRAVLSGSTIASIDESVRKIVIEVYYGGDEELDVSLAVKHKTIGMFEEIASSKTTLKKGKNTIVYDGMSTINWTKKGLMEELRLVIGDKNNPARENIYFVGMSIYKV